MGSERSYLIAQAILYAFGAPPLNPTLTCHQQHNLAVFPIAREGLKYQVTEAIYNTCGFYCDEIVLDAHHPGTVLYAGRFTGHPQREGSRISRPSYWSGEDRTGDDALANRIRETRKGLGVD